MELTCPLPPPSNLLLLLCSLSQLLPCLQPPFPLLTALSPSPPSTLSLPQFNPSTNLNNSFFSLNLTNHSTTARVIFPKHEDLTHHVSHYPRDASECLHQANRPCTLCVFPPPTPLLLVSNTPHPAAVSCCSQLCPVLPLHPHALAVPPTKHALLLPLCIPSPVRIPRQAPLTSYSVAHM